MLLWLGLAAVANADQTAGSLLWAPQLTFDNDLVVGEDANYTHGVRLVLTSEDVSGWQDPRLPALLSRVGGWLGPLLGDASAARHQVAVVLGQALYTPEDERATAVIPDQRPYAAWLYGGIGYWQRQAERQRTLVLQVGVVGPAALGEPSQRLIHKLGDWPEFHGWDHQLDNEPGLQLIWEQQQRWRQRRAADRWGGDLILHAGGSLGNVATYLHTGGEARWGWQLPDNFGTLALRPGAGWQSGREAAALTVNRVHLFAAIDGRWVLRDIFLDGNSFRDSHRVDKEPLLADLALGMAVELGALKLSYAQLWRTREFKAQPHAHQYGSLSLSWQRRF